MGISRSRTARIDSSCATCFSKTPGRPPSTRVPESAALTAATTSRRLRASWEGGMTVCNQGRCQHESAAARLGNSAANRRAAAVPACVVGTDGERTTRSPGREMLTVPVVPGRHRRPGRRCGGATRGCSTRPCPAPTGRKRSPRCASSDSSSRITRISTRFSGETGWSSCPLLARGSIIFSGPLLLTQSTPSVA